MLDPQITLFGRKIQVKGDEDYSPSSNNDSCVVLVDKELAEEESMGDNQEDNSSAETIDLEKDSESQQDYEKQSNDTKNPEQKQLKKPDKILPCPRCKSMNTKFCYYNNYNINQPRHFCRSCYRYWTAGGTMRNVPIGAGRRKNKTSAGSAGSASRFSPLTVSEALEMAQFDGSHHPGTVLTFGPDNPFCESMDQKTGLNIKKGTHPGVNVHVPSPFGSYMWNHPGVNVHVPSPFGHPVFPVPIFHHPYWNGPWVGQISPGSNPSFPTLGKHTRDGQMILTSPNDNNINKTSNVLMPKTLRIDNPDEAAKSSIWSTLGIKKEKTESLSKGFFNSFQSKVVAEKDRDLEAPATFIKANPVALCRSLGFQERA